MPRPVQISIGAMSKIPGPVLDNAVRSMLLRSTVTNRRKFLESVELQIGLKNIDPSRDKRFSGTVRLPAVCKPKARVCVIGDQYHIDLCKTQNIDSISADELKAFNKNKKLIKKWVKKYDTLLATDSLIRQIPRLIGPQLNKMGKFPAPISRATDIRDKIAEIQSTIKFQLKKVTCLGVSIGHVNMSYEQVRLHIVMVINFLVSLLKKGWQNLKSVHIKSSMGPPIRIY